MANPYLQAQADAITNQTNQNLRTNVLPSISSGAISAGGYGGSRQGIAEGNAIGLTNQGLSNSLANLYGTNYQQDQSNDLTRLGLNNQFNLGLGGLGLQSQGLRNQYNLGLGSLGLQGQGQGLNFYTQQRSLDQSGAALGANLYNSGNAGYLGIGTGLQGIGNTQQQAPWIPYQSASNLFSQYSGLGGGQTNTSQGNPIGAGIGGALAGAQIGKNLGFGGGNYGGNGNAPWSNPYDYSGPPG